MDFCLGGAIYRAFLCGCVSSAGGRHHCSVRWAVPHGCAPGPVCRIGGNVPTIHLQQAKHLRYYGRKLAQVARRNKRRWCGPGNPGCQGAPTRTHGAHHCLCARSAVVSAAPLPPPCVMDACRHGYRRPHGSTAVCLAAISAMEYGLMVRDSCSPPGMNRDVRWPELRR